MVLLKINVYNAHHYPGSNVCGEVLVTMDKPKKCENLIVNLLGRANVRWKKEEHYGNVRKTTTYTNQATYIDDQVLVWSQEECPTGELTAGEHHFPFQFQLPQSCPPSFEGRYGQVRYEFEARLTPHGWRKIIGGHTVKASLFVGARAEILRVYGRPETAETTKSVGLSCFNLGSITCSVTLPHTGFSAGQTIPITASINNQTSRTLRIQAIIYRQDIFFSSGIQKMVDTKVVQKLGPRIQPRETASFDNITLDIPRKIYPTIKSCSCISVEYVLAVKIKIPWSLNRTLRIPIMIVSEQPVPAQFNVHPEENEQDSDPLLYDVSQECQPLLQ